MSTTVDLGKITASVTVGTTTTGAAGTNASVSNSGTTQDAVLNFTIPRGEQGVQGQRGSTGPAGPAGPTGPQGPMGDVAVITPEQQAAFTMYSVPGQNTDGPMTQKAVTDNLVAGSISYDNSQSGLALTNVQGALDEVDGNTRAYMDIDLSLSPFVNYRIATSTKKFTTNTSDKQIFVQIIGGEEYMIAFPNDVPWGNYAWLTDIHVSSGGTPSYCNGETNTITIQAGESRLIKAPSDAQYICITASSNGTSTMPSYFRQILRSEGIERKLDSFVSRNTPYYQSLTNYASGTVSTGEFQTSNNSYVVSSSNYGLWYDVTSFVGKKLKFIKKTGQMRVTFSNTILTSAISNLTPYLLSNIYISDTDFEVVIPQNEGGSVYLWVHYVKGGVDRQPLDILLEGNTNSMGEELNYINRAIYGIGAMEYSGEKINLNNIFKYRVNLSLMNLDAGTSSAYLQGADVFGNYFFQFYVGGRCCVYDLTTLTKVKEFTLSNFSSEHFGSVHFSNEYPNTGELPLMYTESSASDTDVLVIDINPAYNGTGDALLVRTITLTDYPYPNVCCAFDFSAGIGYMIGRPVAAERFGRYYLQPFNIQDGSYDIEKLIDVKSSGPLQDATFRNNVVYIVSGWNNLYNGEGYTNYAVPQRITAVNVLKKAITAVLETGIVSSSNAGEPESIAIYNNSFYVSRRSSSTNNKLMKIEV